MDTTTPSTRIPMSELPENIQDLLNSELFIEDIERICDRNGLRPEEYGPVLRTTVRLLRGEIPATGYVAELIEETGIPREKVALIAQEINRDIFNAVKDSLKALHTTPRIEQGGPVPPSPTPLPVAPLASTPPTPAANIFEQKLGGAFRMPSSATTAAPPAPVQIVPPAPQPVAPAVTQTPTPKAIDPYREAA